MSAKKIELDVELILKLRSKGVSRQAIATRFSVSLATIKRLLKDYVQDPAVLSFARRLEKLVAEAPDEYCRKEVNRAVNFLRTQQAASRNSKFHKITEAIASGAREIESIAEECGFSKRETLLLVGELINNDKVERRPRGGRLNGGSKQAFHYYLI